MKSDIIKYEVEFKINNPRYNSPASVYHIIERALQFYFDCDTSKHNIELYGVSDMGKDMHVRKNIIY